MSDVLNMPRSRLFWFLQCAGWLAFGSAMWVAGLTHWTLGYASINKAVLVLLGFLLTCCLRFFYRAVSRRGWGVSLNLVIVICASGALSLVWVAVHRVAMAVWLARLTEVPFTSFIVPPDVTAVLYQSFVLIAWGVLYFGINAHLDLQSERERLIRAEALAQEAKLKALRFQLQPHFLFNTLNAISTLVSEGRNGDADRMIGRLSEFLRTTLVRPDTNEIALAEEIEFLERYLEIEKVRFGDRLGVDVQVDPQTSDALVPAMILQPLVENAVQHGIVHCERGGWIRIGARRDEADVWLTVQDDGPDTNGGAKQGTGIGLSNTRLRLSEMYGSAANLELVQNGRGTRVSIRLPYRSAGDRAQPETVR